MQVVLEAATGLPVIVFTAALVVLVCFWLLVAVGVMDMDSFDRDVDLAGWGLGGVPVAVALSLLIVLAWSFSIGATALLVAVTPGEVPPGFCLSWRRSARCSVPGG